MHLIVDETVMVTRFPGNWMIDYCMNGFLNFDLSQPPGKCTVNPTARLFMLWYYFVKMTVIYEISERVGKVEVCALLLNIKQPNFGAVWLFFLRVISNAMKFHKFFLRFVS